MTMPDVLLPDSDLMRAASRFLTRAVSPSGVTVKRVHGLVMQLDGGDSPIPSNYTLRLPIFWNLDILGWEMVADVAGSLDVVLSMASYAAYPTPSPLFNPAVPTISLGGAIKNWSKDLSTWTIRTLADSDILLVSVLGTPTVKSATLALRFVEN